MRVQNEQHDKIFPPDVSLLYLHQKNPPESAVWIVQKATVVVSSRYNWQEVSFVSFPLEKCHIGGGLVHSFLPCSYNNVFLLFFLLSMAMLTYIVSKVKDVRQQQTCHASQQRTEETRNPQALQRGIFHSSLSLID